MAVERKSESGHVSFVLDLPSASVRPRKSVKSIEPSAEELALVDAVGRLKALVSASQSGSALHVAKKPLRTGKSKRTLLGWIKGS